ncbi:hypothetical protein FRC03_008455 [Tulasnella sp. 419]|nr:hypothetical protein FRC03_008455 [Tulasnella sp. 419]
MAELDDSNAKKVIYSTTRSDILPKLVDNLLRIGDYIPPDKANMFSNTGASKLLQFLEQDEDRRKIVDQKGYKVFFNSDKIPDHGAMIVKVGYVTRPDELAECGAVRWALRMIGSNKVGQRAWAQGMDLYGTIIKFFTWTGGEEEIVNPALKDDVLHQVKEALQQPISSEELSRLTHKGALEFLRGFTIHGRPEWLARLVEKGLIAPISRIFADESAWIVLRVLALEVLAGLTDNETGKGQILIMDFVMGPCVRMLSKLSVDDRIELGHHFTLSSRPKPEESAADLLFKFSSSTLLVPALETWLSSPQTFAKRAELLEGMDGLVRNSTASTSLIKAGLVRFLFNILDTPWESALASVDGVERAVLRAKSVAMGCLVILTHETPQVPHDVKEALMAAGVNEIMKRVHDDKSNPDDIKGMTKDVLGRLMPGAPISDGYMLMLRN